MAFCDIGAVHLMQAHILLQQGEINSKPVRYVLLIL